jgi:hypothetical protein
MIYVWIAIIFYIIAIVWIVTGYQKELSRDRLRDYDRRYRVSAMREEREKKRGRME